MANCVIVAKNKEIGENYEHWGYRAEENLIIPQSEVDPANMEQWLRD